MKSKIVLPTLLIVALLASTFAVTPLVFAGAPAWNLTIYSFNTMELTTPPYPSPGNYWGPIGPFVIVPPPNPNVPNEAPPPPANGMWGAVWTTPGVLPGPQGNYPPPGGAGRWDGAMPPADGVDIRWYVRAPLSVPYDATHRKMFNMWHIVSVNPANAWVSDNVVKVWPGLTNSMTSVNRWLTIHVINPGAIVQIEAKYDEKIAGPALDTLYMKMYGSPVPEYTALKAGDIDLMDWSLSLTQYQDAIADPNLKVEEGKDLGMFEFDLNNNATVEGLPGAIKTQPGEPNPMANVLFRRAIARLVDKVTIAKEDFAGLLEVMDTPMASPVHEVYINSTTVAEWRTGALSFNPTEVNKLNGLLDQAGFVQGTTTNPNIGPAWSAAKIRINPLTGKDLKPLIIYSRSDKPDRDAAGRRIRDMLQWSGIPVDFNSVDRTTCFRQVMAYFAYHIYTGGWGLGRDPDHLHDFYTYEFANPYDYNYMIHNAIYTAAGPVLLPGGGPLEAELDLTKYAPVYSGAANSLINATKKAQGLLFGSKGTIPSIILGHYTPMYTAYRAGWKGIINGEGVGVRSIWTRYLANKPGTTVMKYGMASTIEKINPVTSEWLWDFMPIEIIYDSLIMNDVYTLPIDQTTGLAEWWNVGTWNDAGTTKTLLQFRIRDNVKWHDGSPMTAEDVKFSIEYHKAQFGWFYSSVMDVKSVTISDYDASKGVGGIVTVYMDKLAYLALHWVGGIPIIRKAIWENIVDAYQYNPHTDDKYPWPNGDGIVDIKQDGTGPWKFDSWLADDFVNLVANREFYCSYLDGQDVVDEAFHRRGDADYNFVVDATDLALMGKAYSSLPYQTTPTWVDDYSSDMIYSPAYAGDPYNTGWQPPIDQWKQWRTVRIPYKPEDINYDNYADLTDLITLAKFWRYRGGTEP